MKTIKTIVILFLFINFLSCNTPQEERYTIAFSQCCADEWRDVMNQEMMRELVFHPNVDFKIVDAKNNNEHQINDIEKLVSEGIDLLIVSPNETAAITPILEKVYDSGIPTIILDRKIDSYKYTAFLGADNYQIGYTAGKYIANKFDFKGNVLELRMEMSITPAVERANGFRDAIAEYREFSTVASLKVPDLRQVQDSLPSILKEHPEIDIVFGQTDMSAIAAQQLISKTLPNKKIAYFGIDGLPVSKGIKDVIDGKLDASFLYPTGGVEAIRLAMKILNNEDFEKDNKLATSVIDKSNAEVLYAQIKKINEQQASIEKLAIVTKELNATFSTQRNTLYITITLLCFVVIFGAIMLYLFKDKQQSNKLLAAQNLSINQQKDEIEKVSKLAKDATEEKMRFYSYVSHEFKTPLSLILTPVGDIINRKDIGKVELSGTLKLIEKNASRLLRLVNQLLDIRQLDSGKIKLEAKKYDVIAFLKDIVNDFTTTAGKRKIDLRFQCDFDQLPFTFDYDKLDKVFFNLLSNAFKYTLNNGYIHITLRKDTDRLVITVEDNGIGMTDEEKAHAFDLFYRGNDNISLGTGLGLALTHEFVSLHGGEILLESQKNAGSKFTVFLPYMDQDSLLNEQNLRTTINHVIDDKSVEVEDDEFISPNASSIVIVEDNSDMLQFLKSKFQQQYSVFTALNAEIGWDLILKNIPDLIISDVMLPGKNGFELTTQVKTDFRTSHIPVVLLTAKGQLESQIEGTKAGADAYLPKPFNQQFLEEKVIGLLENRNRMKRRFSNEVMDNAPAATGERKFLIEFEELIQQGINSNTLSVESLSSELGMSRVQLYRKITALTGGNVNDYIANFKIKKAKIALKKSTKNISEIAYELGFSSPAYFTTFFKQRTGTTPTEWRA